MPDSVSLAVELPSCAPAARTLLHATRQRALRLLREQAAAREVLTQLVSAVESMSEDGCVASILVLDREGLLRNGASPSLPADYLDAIDRIKPDPGLGTCAAAAATGEIVYTPDFQDDARWAELRHLPLALGFRGAWSMPIKDAEGQVLGTFGTYFRQTRLPTAQERETIAFLMPLAAAALASQQALT